MLIEVNVTKNLPSEIQFPYLGHITISYELAQISDHALMFSHFEVCRLMLRPPLDILLLGLITHPFLM